MEKLINIFNQKFPCELDFSSQLKRASGFGIFITLFLWAFKPFDLGTLPDSKLIFTCCIYGLVTFACILATGILLPLIFRSHFNEEKWTTGKQILLIAGVVVLIGLVNYCISPLLVETSLSLRSLLWFQGITLLISILPITIYTLYRQNRLLRKFRLQAHELEKKLQEKLNPENKNSPPIPTAEKKNETALVELTGDYQGEKIRISPEELYLVASANNYVKVYFLKKGVLSYSIIRMTMKKAEDSLRSWPDFFRCHRAFIVNLDKVVHVEGNAQGYKLQLAHMDERIPVSRNLNNEFSDKLLAVRDNAMAELQ